MASNTWSWSEALKSCRHLCQACNHPIVIVDLVFIQGEHSTPKYTWAHAERSNEYHQIEPVYHLLDSYQMEQLGYKNGMDGARLLDNPYCHSGPLSDGADSMGEASIWWKGWKAAQVVLDKIPEGAPTAQPNGFDYLEAQRG